MTAAGNASPAASTTTATHHIYQIPLTVSSGDLWDIISYASADSDTDTHPHAHADQKRFPDAYTDGCPDTYEHPNGDAHRHGDRHAAT